MDLRDFAQTMSLDGVSHGENIEGLSSTELRTVMYVVVFPNLLISLHPDYVMTHRLVPLSPGQHLRPVLVGLPELGDVAARTSTRRTPSTSGT